MLGASPPGELLGRKKIFKREGFPSFWCAELPRPIQAPRPAAIAVPELSPSLCSAHPRGNPCPPVPPGARPSLRGTTPASAFPGAGRSWQPQSLCLRNKATSAERCDPGCGRAGVKSGRASARGKFPGHVSLDSERALERGQKVEEKE